MGSARAGKAARIIFIYYQVINMKNVEIIDGVPMIRVDSDEDVVILSTGYRRIRGMDVDEFGFEHERRD